MIAHYPAMGMQTTVAGAAAGGYMDVLEWLHARCAPNAFTPTAYTRAIRCGRLDCVQWLYAHGHPWDDRTTGDAKAFAQPAIYNWLIDNGCPVSNRFM